MMRRLFWIGLGAAVAVVVARKFNETKQKYSLAGLVDQADAFASKVGGTIREIGVDIRDGMAERERELTAALLGEPSGPAAGRSVRSVRPVHGGLDDVDEPEYEF
jgi:NADH:ubiquinone oxidoreductase subunit F (NADH-binding)